MAKYFPCCASSSEYDIAKTINFNNVTDEFASIKARNLHCKFAIVHEIRQ
jgi:hypothetical protein